MSASTKIEIGWNSSYQKKASIKKENESIILSQLPYRTKIRRTKFSRRQAIFVNFVRQIFFSDEFLLKTLIRRDSCFCSTIDKNQQRRNITFLTRGTCWNISVITLERNLLKDWPPQEFSSSYCINGVSSYPLEENSTIIPCNWTSIKATNKK